MKKKLDVRFIALSAIYAAMYTALTLINPVSFGLVQFRISEGMTILPYYDKAAIPGLFLGCILSNIIGGNGIFDIIFGSLASLIAAILTSRIKNKWAALLPPVLVNGLIIGVMLGFLLEVPILLSILLITVEQAVVCYIIGFLLIYIIEKNGLFSRFNTLV